MLGLLGMGARVGQWAKLTNILESHITGDPTLRFQSINEVDANALFNIASPACWSYYSRPMPTYRILLCTTFIAMTIRVFLIY